MQLLKKGTKTPVPTRVEAWNCTLIKVPFNSSEWTFEVKLDGYRIVAIKKGNDVDLFTRAGLNYSKYYPAVVEALKAIPNDAVVDGELVVLDEKGPT